MTQKIVTFEQPAILPTIFGLFALTFFIGSLVFLLVSLSFFFSAQVVNGSVTKLQATETTCSSGGKSSSSYPCKRFDAIVSFPWKGMDRLYSIPLGSKKLPCEEHCGNSQGVEVGSAISTLATDSVAERNGPNFWYDYFLLPGTVLVASCGLLTMAFVGWLSARRRRATALVGGLPVENKVGKLETW